MTADDRTAESDVEDGGERKELDCASEFERLPRTPESSPRGRMGFRTNVGHFLAEDGWIPDMNYQKRQPCRLHLPDIYVPLEVRSVGFPDKNGQNSKFWPDKKKCHFGLKYLAFSPIVRGPNTVRANRLFADAVQRGFRTHHLSVFQPQAVHH